jgi:protein-S-isoprenylcysteine O-methyltransferase Ste14
MNRSALFFTIGPLIAVAYVIFTFTREPWTEMRILGLILTAAGAVGITIARIQLGNSFSVRPQARELVTHGLYSSIRNPVYIFGMVLIAGVILYVNRPKFCWIFLILIPLQFVRARAESKVLEEKFGDSYREYKARTWF